jgi:hypothetical protein
MKKKEERKKKKDGRTRRKKKEKEAIFTQPLIITVFPRALRARAFFFLI